MRSLSLVRRPGRMILGLALNLAVAGLGICGGTVAAQDASTEPAWSASTVPVPAVYVSPGTAVRPVEETLGYAEAIAQMPGYAGAFLDNSDPGRKYVPVYLWVGDIETVAADIAELLGQDAAFEIRPVERTYAELQAIADAVSDRTPELNAHDVLVVAITTDVKRNRIDVGVQGSLEVAAEVLASLGPGVHIAAEEPSVLD